MAYSRYLKLRLFLEGVEVDVRSATVSCGINIAASANILIPPASSSMEFLPRTLVHLFFYEENSAVAKDINDLRSWNLLFGGEVIGFAYINSGGARSTSLMCQDFSSYWGSARLYWGGTRKTSFQNLTRAIYAGASQVHKGRKKGKDTITSILQRAPVSNPKLTGLMGGLISLLESATGVYDAPEGKAAKNFRGVNDFMNQAELRLHLTRMLGVPSKDDSSAAFINSSSFKRYFRRLSSSVKSTASFMELLNVILSKIYYRHASVAAPPYFAKGETVKVSVRESTGSYSYSGNATIDELYRAVTQAWKATVGRIGKRRLAVENVETHLNNKDYLRSIQRHGGTDPPIDPDVAGHTKYAADISASSILNYTEAVLRPMSLSVVQASRGKGGRAESRANSTAMGIGYVSDAVEILNRIVARTSGADPFQGHTATAMRAAGRILELARNKLKTVNSTTYTSKDKLIELDDRLFMFLFHPDIYMVPPPVCNVLFPEDYSSLQYSRGWLMEITRLWLFGRTESGRDKKDIYFSPNISMLGVDGMDTAVEAVNKGASFIMQHEKYTGIIPTFQGLGDNGIFKTLHKKELSKQDKKKAAFGGDASVSGRAQHTPQEHLQRAANFMFFSARFSSRQMQSSGRFLPRLVPGLPALLLNPDLVDVASPSDDVGVHFVGVPSRITHQVTAEGGADTQVVYVSCRTHNEGLDLFADPTAGEITRTLKRTVSKTILPPAGTDFTIEYKGKHEVSGYARTEQATPESVIGLTAMRGARYTIRPKDYRKEAGFEQDVSVNNTGDGHRTVEGVGVQNGVQDDRFASSSSNVVTDPNNPGLNVGLVVEVTQTKTLTSSKKISFSLEDTLTPPWFSSIYRRQNIGPEYYQVMIGCPSILDQPLVQLTEDAEGNVEEAVAAGDITGGTTAFFGPANAPNEVVVAEPAGPIAAGSITGGTTAFFGPDNRPSEVTVTEASILGDTEPTETLGPLTVTVPIKTGDGSIISNIELPVGLLDGSSTTASAAEALAAIWIGLTNNGADVDLFISSFTQRRFASMQDILGTTNPYLSMKLQRASEPIGEPNVLGFHGNAYGNYENLEGVDGNPLLSEELRKGGNERGAKESISPKIDPRLERRLRVISYLNALNRRTASSDL